MVVTDSISLIRYKPSLRSEEFLTVDLKKGKGKTGEMIITDGNNNVLHKQDYKYTDAKRNLKFFYRNNVLMLPSEY